MTPEQRASQALFGRIDFDHQGVDGPYSLDGENVSYSELVARYRTEDAPWSPARDALERIVALLSGDRTTVTPENAWQHWQVANATLVEVRRIARDALS